MNKKRTCAWLLSTVLAVTGLTTGCGGPSVNKTMPDYDKSGAIYRAAWWCPKPTEENYDLYKDCNLNTVMLVNHNYMAEIENFWGQENQEQLVAENSYYIGRPSWYQGETMTEKSLALAKDKGLYVFLADGGAYFNWIGKDVDVFRDFEIDYSDYEEQIVGVFAGDEPSEPGIAEYGEKVEAVQKTFPNLPYFCNLFPMYADINTQIQSTGYDTYVETYCKQVLERQRGPRIISVDYYPFQGSQFDLWLRNYSIVQEKAKAYDAGIHFFIQSCVGQGANFDPLTEEDIRLQVNVALAYGAKQYSYYVYDVPLGGDLYESGLVDREGKPVKMYEFAQKANAETASLEQAYAHYDTVLTAPVTEDESDYSVGSFSTIDRYGCSALLEEAQVLTDVTATNRGLVTLMKDKDGNEAYYLVNFYDKGDVELEEDCTFTLQFDGMKQVALYGSKDCLTGKNEKVKENTFKCTLAPGEGILVVPYRK